MSYSYDYNEASGDPPEGVPVVLFLVAGWFVMMMGFILWHIIPWGSLFVPGEEHFLNLLRDPHHLAFEFLTGIAQTIVLDVLVLAVVWPRVKRHFHSDIEDAATKASGGWSVKVTDKHEGHSHE